MSTDSTGNNGPLSFADKLSFSERKRLKCFPAMMHIEQIATLEHPDSLERQKTLALALIDACERGELPSIPDQQYDEGWIEDGLVFGWWHKTLELCEGPTPIISREAYQAWRAQCPARLLSDLSRIGDWLGATPGMAVSLPAESIPPVETFPLETPVSTAQTPVSTAQTPVALGGGNPVHSRKRVADKREFIKSATWRGNQTNTVNGHPQAARFKGAYGEDCLLKWARELDPRLRDKRGGRPRKT